MVICYAGEVQVNAFSEVSEMMGAATSYVLSKVFYASRIHTKSIL